MISLDVSLIWAVVIFLALVVALNKILFDPLFRVREERESKTTGLMAQTGKRLDQIQKMLDEYHAAIKNGRMDAYHDQELLRANAMEVRAAALAKARAEAEKLILEARDQIREQVDAAKAKLDPEAREIADKIAANILRRTA